MNANNISTPSKLSKIDFYRRVPRDLTEATSLGATMSIIAMALMGVLFISESLAFARTDLTTSITLDANYNHQLRINFNITMFDVHCDFLVVDVLDALGTNRQNVTKNVEKWQLDSNGDRRIYSGRNRPVRDLVHEQHSKDTLEGIQRKIEEEENHAIELTDEASYKEYLQTHELAFIDFYAPWCIWCQRLHPTWELFAQEVHKENLPLGVAMVNCVDHSDLCRSADIRAFPTLRWFQKGEPVLPGQ
jgi:thiol-disulfide isomerase/thioredoxin